MQNRAYSTFQVKSFDVETRTIEGIASSPNPDRMGDVVESRGAQFTLPIPLLWQHDHEQPIGEVYEASVTDEGIVVKARLARIDEPATLKERLDTAWSSIKHGLVRGLSIGFRSLKHEAIKGTVGIRFLKWELLELSAVTVPANMEASIAAIKSLSPASGHAVTYYPPGATGTHPKPLEGKAMNIQEQIAALEARRQAHAARMTAIMEKSAEEGRTLDEPETEEYDGLQADVKSIDAHLVRARELEKVAISKATPVTPQGTSTPDKSSETRGGHVSIVPQKLPPGTAFVRYAMALVAGRGDTMRAIEYAKRWRDSTPEVEMLIKSASAPGLTSDSDWAAPLVNYQNLAAEFVEYMRPQTIIGRIPGLRRVPFNISMPTQTQGGLYGWVGENAPKPVGELKFGTLTLRWAKAAGIIVLTEELVRVSNPAAESVVRADMTAGIAQFLDVQFVDPSVGEVNNVSPASITNGISPVSATGTDAAAVRADVQTLFSSFLAAGLAPTNAVWIMSNTTALALSLMQNPLGQPDFPGITMNGGTFVGLPVVTSESVPTDTTGSLVILANASDILLADDGGVTIDVSREASLQMDNAPSPGAQSLVSLWQNNLVGLRAERFINWKRRRDEAVGYISGVSYGAPAST